MNKAVMKEKDFKKIVSLYDKKLDNVIGKFEKNADNVKDIKQDIYVKIFKNSFSFVENSNIWGWVKKTTENYCKNYIRDNSKFKFFDLFDSDTGLNLLENLPDEKADLKNEMNSKDTQQFIYNCVCKLKPKYKEIIVLYDFEEYSYEQIAQKLKCPIGTVKSRLFNARMILKEELKELL